MRRLLYLVFTLLIIGGCKTIYVSDTEVAYNRISESSKEADPEVKALIAPYKKDLDVMMNEVIGTLDVSLTKERPESTIGNWLADMLYEEAKQLNNGVLDFAIQNHGGIRVNGMTKGPITRGEIFEVMPFDNLITIISADGRNTQLFLDHIAEGRGWPVSSGLSFKIKDKKAVDVMVNGQPLDLDQMYHFALPDYIANGGSGSNMLIGLQRKDLDTLIRDAFISHVKKDDLDGIIQTAAIEGRIINLDHE